MFTCDESAQAPFVIFHWNVLDVAEKFETVVVGLDGVAMIPLPLTNDHMPVPTDGVFPARVAALQTVCGRPALAAVTFASTVSVTLPVTIVGVQLKLPEIKLIDSFTV